MKRSGGGEGGGGRKRGRRAGFKFSHAVKHSKLFNNSDGATRGFLATFETRLVTLGITEALAVLSHFADRLYGPVAEGGKRFCVYDAGVSGLAAIRAVDDTVQPLQLAKYIAECLTTGPVDESCVLVARTKSLQRLAPVQLFCAASTETLRTAAKPLIESNFASPQTEAAAAAATAADGVTFAVDANTRGSQRLTREDAITTVAGLVASPPHKVDLKKPQVTIVLDVFKSACALCCVENYAQYHRFNLRALLGDRVPKEMLRKPRKKPGKQEEAPKEKEAESKADTPATETHEAN